MNNELYYTVFKTAAGWVGLLGLKSGLRRTTLPEQSESAVREIFRDSLKNAVESPQHFTDLVERFQAYFNGYRVEFPAELDFTGATRFQQSVWQAARLIPYGQTRSYGWVAAKAGNPEAARAAGQALGKNPLPIIVPCHRVLAANGGLGGFSWGLNMKRFLLRLEVKTTVSD
jgi:methylated-DNA-[protein]-cysteine S-methyltransferase